MPRLLVVDDDELVSRTITGILRQRGFEVVTCQTPLAALARDDLAQFNLLITDLRMPSMTGIELIQRIQAVNPQLCAVLLTGYASVESATEAMRTGAVDVLQKPVRSSALLGSVQRALEVQQLRSANKALHAEVTARVAELEEVNRELDAFAARLSHDLRAPITTMTGIATLLQDELGDKLDDELRQLVGQMVTSGHEALKMTADLLEFARLGDAELERVPVDLSAVVEQVLDALRPDMPAGRVQLRVEGLCWVMGHAGLLRQAFTNLVGNALKYSASRPTIAIGVHGSVHSDGTHEICVSDNGVGFDPAQAANLFKPFHRLHSAAQFQGSGMGLANVRRIVERHGGTVWAHSQPGAGARFFVRMKAADPIGPPR